MRDLIEMDIKSFKSYQKKLGLTNKECAKALGVSIRSVEYWRATDSKLLPKLAIMHLIAMKDKK